MAHDRFEMITGGTKSSRAVEESAREALSATSLTAAYHATGQPIGGRTTTGEAPRLRLLRSDASGTSREEKRWYTVADVAKACGLPQPVIAQVVPRTWTKDGWMYTGGQLQSAIEIAQEMRQRRSQSD